MVYIYLGYLKKRRTLSAVRLLNFKIREFSKVSGLNPFLLPHEMKLFMGEY
jgi:hypothetical protein